MKNIKAMFGVPEGTTITGVQFDCVNSEELRGKVYYTIGEAINVKRKAVKNRIIKC